MLYNKDNIKLLYFSPYLKAERKGKEIIFYNYIFETIVTIKYNEEMIRSIENGIELEDLMKLMNKYFKKKETEEIIKRLIAYGVVE